MKAVWVRVRADLRSSLGASVAIVLMIGVTGGLVLGAAAGARRTQTAYPRFLAASDASDLLVSVGGSGLGGLYDAVERLPGVKRAGPLAGVELAASTSPGPLDPLLTVSTNASVDGRAAYTIERPNVLSGRVPRPDRAAEVLVTPAAAGLLHVSVGSRLQMQAVTTQVQDPSQLRPSDLSPVALTVVGIGVFPEQILPITRLDDQPQMLLTPAYYRTHSGPGLLAYDGDLLQLRPGTDVAKFRAEVAKLAQSYPADLASQLFIADQSQHTALVERAIFPQALALWLFAGLVGAGLLLVIGLMLARRLSAGSLEQPILRALGMTRGQLVAADLIGVAILAVSGGVLAVGVAILGSPLGPFGPTRLAEPDPGISVNVAILGVGFAALVILLLAAVTIPAWRSASASGSALGLAELPGADRQSRLAERATRGGLPPSAGAGIRMALEPGRGRTAVPVRSGVVGLAVGVAALTAAFTFGTNLTRIVATPRLYGWNWDVVVDGGFVTFPTDAVERVAGGVAAVAGYTGGNYGDVAIDGKHIPAVGLDPLKGSVFPTMIQGRPLASDDEIVLGAKDLRRVHGAIGDSVRVQVGTATRSMRIVGQAVFPALGRGSFIPTGLGEGAIVTAGVLATEFRLPADSRYNFVLIRYATGADPRTADSALRAALDREGCPPQACALRAAGLPGDIATYRRIRATPLILAGVLSALAFALMAYTLLTSVRRRRRDLAVLKTMGFLRRQVSAVVAWQATTLAAIAALFGLPLGVIAGRWAWSVFATQLGVPPTPVVPGWLIVLTIPVAVLAANLIAWVPGRMAARTKPAIVLRSE